MEEKFEFFAIKDAKTGLFYNRANKDLRPLMQNTALYRTYKQALSETNPCHGNLKSRVCDAIFDRSYPATKYEGSYYKLRLQYYEKHKNDFDFKIVKIKLIEVS